MLSAVRYKDLLKVAFICVCLSLKSLLANLISCTIYLNWSCFAVYGVFRAMVTFMTPVKVKLGGAINIRQPSIADEKLPFRIDLN